MKKKQIYNYSETTYGVKEFGAKGIGGRIDVTYFLKTKSKAEFLRRVLALKHMRNISTNWVRERCQKGSGGMNPIIDDDGIYVTVDYDKIIGKFTKDGTWIAFNPPKTPCRPWLDDLKKRLPKQNKKRITNFEGYMSGDSECFCLSKIPFNDWCKIQKTMPHEGTDKEFMDWHNRVKLLIQYPSKFFPEECRKGKWKFIITVEATPITEV